MKHAFLSLAALLPFTIASPQDYGSPDTSSQTSASSAPTAALEMSGAVHTVEAGKNSFTFNPDTLMAKPGDVIQFQLFNPHSVARSTFDNPCQPMTGAGSIWSGFSSNDNTFFTMTVNNTDPIWLYCAVPTDCQLGMAMVVNPPSGGNTIAAYKSAAKGTSNSGVPANVAGGVFGRAPASSASGGSSGTSAASTTAAATSSTGGAESLVANLILVGGLLFGGFANLL